MSKNIDAVALQQTASNFNIVYRPCRIDNMIGSVNTRRLIANSLAHQAYPQVSALSGVAGIGKSTVAKCIALALQCSNPVNGQPCLKCDRCKSILKNLFLKNENTDNIFIYNMAKMTTKEDAERLMDYLKMKKPSSYNYTVYILEEPQNMSPESQDTLLTTLEYIPDDTYIILCTTDLYKMRKALISRCQPVFYLSKPTLNENVSLLKSICDREHITYDKNLLALKLISDNKGNIPRDSIETLQLLVRSQQRLDVKDVMDLLNIIPIKHYLNFFTVLDKDISAIIEYLEGLQESGINLSNFTYGLLKFTKDALKMKYKVSLNRYTPNQIKECNKVLKNFDYTFFLKVQQASTEIKFSANEDMAESQLLAFALKLSAHYNINHIKLNTTSNEVVKSTKNYTNKRTKEQIEKKQKINELANEDDIMNIISGNAISIKDIPSGTALNDLLADCTSDSNSDLFSINSDNESEGIELNLVDKE